MQEPKFISCNHLPLACSSFHAIHPFLFTTASSFCIRSISGKVLYELPGPCKMWHYHDKIIVVGDCIRTFCVVDSQIVMSNFTKSSVPSGILCDYKVYMLELNDKNKSDKIKDGESNTNDNLNNFIFKKIKKVAILKNKLVFLLEKKLFFCDSVFSDVEDFYLSDNFLIIKKDKVLHELEIFGLKGSALREFIANFKNDIESNKSPESWNRLNFSKSEENEPTQNSSVYDEGLKSYNINPLHKVIFVPGIETLYLTQQTRVYITPMSIYISDSLAHKSIINSIHADKSEYSYACHENLLIITNDKIDEILYLDLLKKEIIEVDEKYIIKHDLDDDFECLYIKELCCCDNYVYVRNVNGVRVYANRKEMEITDISESEFVIKNSIEENKNKDYVKCNDNAKQTFEHINVDHSKDKDKDNNNGDVDSDAMDIKSYHELKSNIKDEINSSYNEIGQDENNLQNLNLNLSSKMNFSSESSDNLLNRDDDVSKKSNDDLRDVDTVNKNEQSVEGEFYLQDSKNQSLINSYKISENDVSDSDKSIDSLNLSTDKLEFDSSNLDENIIHNYANPSDNIGHTYNDSLNKEIKTQKLGNNISGELTPAKQVDYEKEENCLDHNISEKSEKSNVSNIINNTELSDSTNSLEKKWEPIKNINQIDFDNKIPHTNLVITENKDSTSLNNDLKNINHDSNKKTSVNRKDSEIVTTDILDLTSLDLNNVRKNKNRIESIKKSIISINNEFKSDEKNNNNDEALYNVSLHDKTNDEKDTKTILNYNSNNEMNKTYSYDLKNSIKTSNNLKKIEDLHENNESKYNIHGINLTPERIDISKNKNTSISEYRKLKNSIEMETNNLINKFNCIKINKPVIELFTHEKENDFNKLLQNIYKQMLEYKNKDAEREMEYKLTFIENILQDMKIIESKNEQVKSINESINYIDFFIKNNKNKNLHLPIKYYYGLNEGIEKVEIEKENNFHELFKDFENKLNILESKANKNNSSQINHNKIDGKKILTPNKQEYATNNNINKLSGRISSNYVQINNKNLKNDESITNPFELNTDDNQNFNDNSQTLISINSTDLTKNSDNVLNQDFSSNLLNKNFSNDNNSDLSQKDNINQNNISNNNKVSDYNQTNLCKENIYNQTVTNPFINTTKVYNPFQVTKEQSINPFQVTKEQSDNPFQVTKDNGLTQQSSNNPFTNKNVIDPFTNQTITDPFNNTNNPDPFTNTNTQQGQDTNNNGGSALSRFANNLNRFTR